MNVLSPIYIFILKENKRILRPGTSSRWRSKVFEFSFPVSKFSLTGAQGHAVRFCAVDELPILDSAAGASYQETGSRPIALDRIK